MTEAFLWNTLAGVLTLAIFSFLYRDNPFYKMAEYLFVGVAAGYYFCQQYHQVFRPNLITPFGAAIGGLSKGHLDPGGLLLIIPLILGVLLFTRFVPRLAWLSRWPIALMVGAFSGLAIIGSAQGDLVAQIQGSMLDLGAGSAGAGFSNVILTLGLVTTLLYFFFSKEHTGALGWASRVGIGFLMVSFGASYGFTVMARIALLTGRLQFLYEDWPKSIAALFR